jgi:polyisoprenoid-binding protein YceI
MKIVKILSALFISALLPSLACAATYAIDPDHSSIQFKVKHLMVSNVKGSFGKINGTVDIDDKDVTKSKTSVTIDTASIDTGVAKRDEHLRSADFFEVDKFPTMSFVSKKVLQGGKGHLMVTGDLTIRGVTKSVILDVEGPTAEIKDPWGGIRRGATATTKINRKDFGLTWNKALETGGVVVGDEVNILLEVELIKK